MAAVYSVNGGAESRCCSYERQAGKARREQGSNDCTYCRRSPEEPSRAEVPMDQQHVMNGTLDPGYTLAGGFNSFLHVRESEEAV